METYRGHVRNPADAIKLFEACRRGLLPRVQRRLSEKERQGIQSGSVFVWDEREAGMRRWTDGKSWSASRVSGSFLTYREMEGKRGGGNFVPAPRRLGGKTPDSGRASDEDADMDGDGADGYRYKADGLMKQSFSITTSEGQHLHLISYYARPHSNMVELPQPSTDPALRNVVPPKGMYPESTTHDSAPPMRSMPLHQPYMSTSQHPMGGPPPQGMARMPYPYPQGYAPWPPSPMSTPPYGYPSNAYASQLPPPMNGHPSSYHPQHLPPHLQHHMPPQAYDRPPPPPINLSAAPYEQGRLPGQLPQMSSDPYPPSAAMPTDRHLSDPFVPRQTRHMSQPLVDARLPPPLQHQYSAPQELAQTNGSHGLEREDSSHGYEAEASQAAHGSQSIPSISNMVHAAGMSEAPTVLPPVRQLSLSPGSQLSMPVHSNVQSQRNSPPAFVRESTPQQVATATDATTADIIRGGTVTPAKRTHQSFSSDEAPAPAAEGTTTPEMASAEAAKSGSTTPGDAAPEATDIPHSKLAVGGPAGEDLRAIRVLDRKFCI